MLCSARDSDSNARSTRSCGSPRPSSRLARVVARSASMSVSGSAARPPRRAARAPPARAARSGRRRSRSRPRAPRGRPPRARARRRGRERLLAARDRGPAAFAPVVETGEVEQRPGAQRAGAIGDGEQDLPRAFGVAGLDEVVAELERAPVALVGRIGGSQPDRQLGELDRGLRRAAPANLARGLRDGRRDRAVGLLGAERQMPRTLLRVRGQRRQPPVRSTSLVARRRPRRSPTRTTDA